MNLSNLTTTPGSRHRTKRLGRGDASGKGGSAGKGTKGQMSRKGVKHPYRDYGAKKINGNEYRFFFDPLNSQVWADINIRYLTLVVRQSAIRDPEAEVTAIAIKGHYAGEPLRKGEKY